MPFGSAELKLVLTVPNQSQSSHKKAVCVDHTDPKWRANLRFWKSYAKKQEVRNLLQFHCEMFLRVLLMPPGVELSTGRYLPSIVTSEIFLSWLDSISYLPGSSQMHGPSNCASHIACKLEFNLSLCS